MNLQKISELESLQLELLEVQRKISCFILEAIEEDEEEEDEDNGNEDEDNGNEDIDKKGYYQKKPKKRKSRK